MPYRLLAHPATPRSRSTILKTAALALALAGATSVPARADNYGESLAWQFASPSDIAAQAALRELIERRRGGVYAAPVYTTNIDRQYNCSVAATATGNSGAQSALANSPSVTGATSTATGNSNSASVADPHGPTQVGSGQINSGTVGSSIAGGTSADVRGTAWQALNSNQANSGDQSASVTGASACAFGVLN